MTKGVFGRGNKKLSFPTFGAEAAIIIDLANPYVEDDYAS